MSNHNQLCRDGIFGNLQIKSKKVLDRNANLDVNNAKIRGDAKIKGALKVCGPLSTAKRTALVFTPSEGGAFETTCTITESGWYELQEDIPFAPLASGTCALVIDSDNVVVDLCGKELSQDNNITSVIGIKVLSGHTNVTLLGSHGSIVGFSQLGVQIEGGSDCIQIGQDLSIRGCGLVTPTAQCDGTTLQYQGGMQFGESGYLATLGFPAPLGTVDNVTLSGLKVTENCVGAWVGNGDKWTIEDCAFDCNVENRLLKPSVIGRFIPGEDGDALDNYAMCAGMCMWNSQYATDTTPHPADTGHSNWTISNTSFNKNVCSLSPSSLSRADCFGLRWCMVNCTKVIDCTFDSQLAENGSLVSNSTGMVGPQPSEGVEFIRCSFCSNIARRDDDNLLNGVSIGTGVEFSINLPDASHETGRRVSRAQGIIFRECVASFNGVPVGGVAAFSKTKGLNLNNIANSQIIDCVTNNNTVIIREGEEGNVFGDVTGLEIAAGMFDPPVPVENLIISGHQSGRNWTNSSYYDSSSIGLQIIGLSSEILIKDSAFVSNSDDGNISYTTATGVLLFPFFGDDDVNNVIFDSCTFKGHNSGPFSTGIAAFAKNLTVKNCCISDNEIGDIILLYSECSSVINNYFEHNNYGIIDATYYGSSPLIVQNKSWNQIVPAPFIIADAAPTHYGNVSMSTYPTGVEACDNVDIRK